MRFYLLLAVSALALSVNSWPLPAGDVVKYRVPSKFFSKPGDSPQDSLYNLLAQIHYGSAPMHSTAVASEDVSNEIVSSVPERQSTSESSTNEAPEVISVDSTVR